MDDPRCGAAAFRSDEDGRWIAIVPDLPGCAPHADTRAGARAGIDAALRPRTESAEAHGDVLPLPRFRPAERAT